MTNTLLSDPYGLMFCACVLVAGHILLYTCSQRGGRNLESVINNIPEISVPVVFRKLEKCFWSAGFITIIYYWANFQTLFYHPIRYFKLYNKKSRKWRTTATSQPFRELSCRKGCRPDWSGGPSVSSGDQMIPGVQELCVIFLHHPQKCCCRHKSAEKYSLP